MAIPSVSIIDIKVDETNKTISYTISYSAKVEFTANQSNYYDYLARKGEAGEPYVGYIYSSGNKTSDSESYQDEYDSGKTSKTISVTYQYFKKYIKESYTGWVNYGSGSYITQSDAENEMYRLEYGKLGLYRVILSSDSKYYIQKKSNTSYSIATDPYPTTGTVTETVSFPKKPETEPEQPPITPEEPPITQDPKFNIKSYTLNSVTVLVEGLSKNDTVIAMVYDANGNGLGSKSESVSSTDGSTKELTISSLNLSPNIEYKVKVSLRVSSAGGAIVELGEQSFTISSQTNISYTLTNITTNSVTVNISGALPGDKVSVSFYGVNTAYGTINPNGTVSIVVNNLAIGKKYSGSIRVNDVVINEEDVVFYTLFEWWKSNPVEGNTMGMYNNSPAPVTAEEWNRLVDLVNSKLSKSIAKVASGDTMDASSGGNVKVVASALGVGVESKEKVTANFFNALKNAINNK